MKSRMKKGSKELKVNDAIEMVEKADRRERNRAKLGFHGRNFVPKPSNLFPFSPVREGRPNPLGLTLDKFDCRILKGVQEHGFKPVREFCKLAKIPERKFYERFRNNKDLGEALKLLAFSNLAVAFPKAMETLSGKFETSPKWAELWLKVVGLINDPGMMWVTA
jgi:hypothetical protein